MKTFSTSGTGNQQTLSEIESDKVPVYNTEADAVADLSNLEENQIGITKDTGNELSQPVNAVESGNLHAVTSNAVAESLSYSTTEQATGGKWIDGKPIYRKTFYPTTQSLTINQWGFCGFANTIMANVDSLIFATAQAIAFGRLCYYTTILARPDLGFYSGAINIDVGSAITIEYTKTTD